VPGCSAVPLELNSIACLFLSKSSFHRLYSCCFSPPLLATTGVSPHFSPHQHHGKSPIFTFKLYPNAGHSQNEDNKGPRTVPEVKPLSIFSPYSAHHFFMSSATIQHRRQQRRQQPTWPTGCSGLIHVRHSPCHFPAAASPSPHSQAPIPVIMSPPLLPTFHSPFPSLLYTYIVLVDLYMGQIYMILA
jgi:hypothetical protein